MSASLHDLGLDEAASFAMSENAPRHPAPRGLQRWERPLAAWAVIVLCSAFWYGVLRLFGVM